MELNKLSRKDPLKWLTCPTCLQPYDIASLRRYGGWNSYVMGHIIENFQYIRSVLYGMSLLVSHRCTDIYVK
jgi:hypothetical protein